MTPTTMLPDDLEKALLYYGMCCLQFGWDSAKLPPEVDGNPLSEQYKNHAREELESLIMDRLSASSAPSVVRRNEVQEQFADVANGRDEGASSAGNFTGNPDDAPSDTALLDWLGTHLAGTKWDDALPSIRPREEVKYIHGPNGLRQAIYEAMERGRRRETTGLRAPSGGTD